MVGLIGMLLAVAAGLVAGLAGGGRLRNLAEGRLRSLWLPVVAVVLQGLTGAVHDRSEAVAALIVSYLALGAFAVRNTSRPGMGVLLIGVTLNAAPILLDGGMPVEAHAIVAARVVRTDAEIAALDFGGKRHLAGPGDHLRLLDDRLPAWFSHEVLSIGDLVITIGVAAVVAGLVRDETGRRRDETGRRRDGSAPVPSRGTARRHAARSRHPTALHTRGARTAGRPEALSGPGEGADPATG